MLESLLILYLGIFILCLVASSYFSGMETASISVNRLRLRELRLKGERKAEEILALLSDIHRVITAILVGNNLALVFGALIGQKFLLQALPHFEVSFLGFIEADEIVDIVILTPIFLVFGEILPKQIFRHKADTLMLKLYRPIRLFSRVSLPIIDFFNRISLIILYPLGVRQVSGATTLTREELVEIVEEGIEHEIDKTTEREMIHGIFTLEKTLVREVMMPLVDLVAIRLGEATIKGALDLARQTGYSRFPVFRERIVELIGYVDIYQVLRSDITDKRLEDFVRPAYYVPETKKVDDLLQEFLDQGLQAAIVIDEFGGCSGWVTREDLLEEIVGEIEDEFDIREVEIEKIADNVYEVDADIDIDDLNTRLGLDLPKEGYETLGGLVYTYLGRVPQVGETVKIDDQATVEVINMDKYKIERLRLTLTKPLRPEDKTI